MGIAVLAGCSGASDTSAAEASYQSAADNDSGSGEAGGSWSDSADGFGYAADEGAADAAPESAPDADASGTGDVLLPSDRQIIRTASVTVTIEVEPAEGETRADEEALSAAAAKGARAVRALVTVPGGYVSESDGYGSSITITLRIPADSYDRVMERLSGIGTISARAESTTDVTGEMVDVTSRIKTMQASVDRLRALMAEADSMQNVIALESELSRREADLESLQRRRAAMADQVALSTISVTVEAVTAQVDAQPVEERSAFMKGLTAGWRGVATLGRGVAAIAGALLPFLPVIAVVALAGLWWVRTSRRRRLLPAAAAAGDPLEGGPHIGEIHHDADHGGEPQQ